MKKEWLNLEFMNLGVKYMKDDCYEQVNVAKEVGVNFIGGYSALV